MRRALGAACDEPGRAGCEGAPDLAVGLLAPAALGEGWGPAQARTDSWPEVPLPCAVATSTWSASRELAGPGGARARHVLVGPLPPEGAARVVDDVADGRTTGGAGCSARGEPPATLVEHGAPDAETADRAVRLGAGEGALVVVARRGPAVGVLVVQGTAGTPATTLADAVAAGVCATPAATGCAHGDRPAPAAGWSAEHAARLGDLAAGRGAPRLVRQRQVLPSCGVADSLDDTGQEGAVDAVADCLRAASRGVAGAEAVLVLLTTEGDAVVSYVRALPGPGPSPYEVLVDGTRDAFGPQVWTRQVCPAVADLGAWGPSPCEGAPVGR